MARQQTILTVLLASPSDVEGERDIAAGVVQEFNGTWSRQLGITLELVRWEVDVHPAAGEDTQQVINDQLPEYDILLCVFWTRVGTPTPRAVSGTIEEFERAHARYLEAPSQFQILTYFSNVLADPDLIDPDQLSKLKEFKKRIAGLGVLYSSYKSRDDFATRLRNDIARLVQGWPRGGGTSGSGGLPRSMKPSPSEGTTATTTANSATQLERQVSPEAPEDASDSDGFLDLIEVGKDAFEKATTTTKEISDAIQLLGDSVRTRSELIVEMQKEGKREAKPFKQLINLVAADMNVFAEKIRDSVPTFSAEFSAGLNAFGKAAVISVDFGGGNEQVKQVLSSIETMKTGINAAREANKGMRVSILGVPRMTSEFQRARRKTIEALDEFDRALGDALDLSHGVEETLQRIVDSALENQDGKSTLPD